MDVLFSTSDSIISSPKIITAADCSAGSAEQRPANSTQEANSRDGLQANLNQMMLESADELRNELLVNARPVTPTIMSLPMTRDSSVDPQAILVPASGSSNYALEQARIVAAVPRRHSLPATKTSATKARSALYQQATSRRRSSHLESEKKRRINMRDCYDRLAESVPAEFTEDGSAVNGCANRPSKSSVLRSAHAYLQHLLKECEQLEAVNAQARRLSGSQ